MFIATYWIPIAAWTVLVPLCLRSPFAGRSIENLGHLLSNAFYNAFDILSLGLLLFVPIRPKDKRTRWWALDIAASSFLMVQAIKWTTRLPRPSGGPDGFPSGHTTFSFALAWAISTAYPRLTPLWFAIAAAIGWSRVEVHAHFTYQVLVGAILGCLIGWLVCAHPAGLLFPRILAQWRKRTA